MTALTILAVWCLVDVVLLALWIAVVKRGESR